MINKERHQSTALFRRYKFSGNKRTIASAWLSFLAVGCSLLCLVTPQGVALASETMTEAQIAAANKPGTVMILTLWDLPVSLRHAVLETGKLQSFASRQVGEHLIQDSPQARNKAELEEFIAHPGKYLSSAREAFSGEVEIYVTGSGFIITPDGYIVTNAHVVQYGPDIEKVVYSSWATKDSLKNSLREFFNEDYQRIEKYFEGRVGSEASEGRLKDSFVDAEEDLFRKTVLINKDSEPQIFMVKGVAVLGSPTQNTKVICDLRKRGKVGEGEKDIAILKVEEANLPTVSIGDDNTVNVGDKIAVLGYPIAAEVVGDNKMGTESTITAGELSARRKMPSGWSLLQTSAAINSGNSGGPAFNEHGEVIGIATYKSKEATGINFLIPISVAKEFLNELNIKPQQSHLSQLYDQGVASMNKSCYKGALEKFKEVKEISSGFPFVETAIAECRSAIDQGKDRCWMPDNTYIYGAIGTVVIILTAVWLLMRNRSTVVAEAAGVGPIAVPSDIGDANVSKPETGFRPHFPRTIDVSPPKSLHSFGSIQGATPPFAGKRFEITKQGLLIGRDASKCQIVVEDDSVSKEHAWIVPIDGGTVVIDRGSTNGTFINSPTSPKVSKMRLQNGDKIFIGKSSAVFTYLTS